jgi:hypothetical protein
VVIAGRLAQGFFGGGQWFLAHEKCLFGSVGVSIRKRNPFGGPNTLRITCIKSKKAKRWALFMSE